MRKMNWRGNILETGNLRGYSYSTENNEELNERKSKKGWKRLIPGICRKERLNYH